MNRHSSIPIGALNRSSPRQQGETAAPSLVTFSIGAETSSPLLADPSNLTAGAGAPSSRTLPCEECNGSGEICWARHHPDDPRADRWAMCHECDGTGEVDVTCECGSPFDARGYCAECECFDGEPQCLQCGSPLEEAPCADCESNVAPLTSFEIEASPEYRDALDTIARVFLGIGAK